MFWRKRGLTDFSEEVKAHLELETERLKAQGLSEAEARAAAFRAFGNVTQAQERFYESGRWIWFDHLVQDVRFGLRQLRRSPGFTAVAVLTLALGIGANTVIFSAVYAVLLKPLPFKDLDRLVTIWERNPEQGYEQNFAATGTFHDWQYQNRNFEDMAIFGLNVPY